MHSWVSPDDGPVIHESTASQVGQDISIENSVYPGVLYMHERVSCEDAVRPDVGCGIPAGSGTARAHKLNKDAATFVSRNPDLVHRGVLVPDLAQSWEQVQRV